MPRVTLTTILNKAAAPTLLIDGDGQVRWANSAAQRTFQLRRRKVTSLSTLLSEECVSAILATTSVTQVAAQFLAEHLNELRLTICAWEIAAGGPGVEQFLVSFRVVSLPPPQRTPDHNHFLSTVAHDLKNPLAAIFGYCDALLDSAVGEGLSERHRGILGRVRGTAARSVELVRNAQHVAYLESLGGGLPRPPNDLNSAVASVVDYTWRDEAPSPKLAVILNPEPVLVGLERTELERVITNLFLNALKYTPQTAEIRLKTFEEGEFGCFEVYNSLPIIDEQDQKHLFAKFMRGGTSSGVSGSGLGLYIVKLICESVGGSVHLRSQHGSGTTFTVRIPKPRSSSEVN